ncbi:GDP-mannose 4,6-dehydratase [Alphaproteobacteria bacterium]|nr:GDP-mannose 4,6-dehydratase [Alphaproteobacteria bacterium]
MKRKKAFITGIAGQDGSYLAEHLLENDYDVFGIIRRNSTVEHQRTRIENLTDIKLEYGDVTDFSSISKQLKLIKPDEVYNLAAQSHVRVSFDVPEFTVQSNGIGVLNVLECFREHCPKGKLYQASSSEMFGSSVDEDGLQRESTKMLPVSPYGAAKLLGFHLVRLYRTSYNLFCSNGILFNHESPRRGSNFVTNKVIKTAVEIKLNKSNVLELGNMDAKRDWGHSKDYVRAMKLILNHNKPDDWTVSTGFTFSVRDLCEYTFKKLDLDYNDYVISNPKFFRPQELPYLKGDSSRIRSELGWSPDYSFEQTLDEMIEHWLKIYKNSELP